MRGIIFTGGNAPDLALAAKFISGYRYVVAADSGLTSCERAGIVPDLIVGDMDSLEDRSSLARYPAERVRIYPRDKDFTDTEIALGALAELGATDVILVGGGGGRIDHFLALRALFDRSFFPAIWVSDASVCVAVGDGTPSVSVRVTGLSRSDPVSVFPAGSGVHGMKGTGFHWNINGLDWDAGEFSLSNYADSSSVALEAASGRFFIVFPLSSAISVERI